jgi:hypothetical protein
MPTITFNVPAQIVAELNALAVEQGYSNAKDMVISHLKTELKQRRQRIIRQTEANIDDAVIT